MRDVRDRTFESVARVEFHLDGGFTRVVLEDLYYDGAEPRWEIPTDLIPRTLRSIGSRFLLSGEFPDPDSEPDAVRQTLRCWTARPIR
jgi:hypothetical protein